VLYGRECSQSVELGCRKSAVVIAGGVVERCIVEGVAASYQGNVFTNLISDKLFWLMNDHTCRQLCLSVLLRKYCSSAMKGLFYDKP